jgi:ubiquinone/menaquinone biosynthesis C-methylase UbiE
MESEEAIRLIRPAVEGAGGSWADFGAGSGTFTRALLAILGPEARILAVDRDARALEPLSRAPRRAGEAAGRVEAVPGDLRRPGEIPALEGVSLDGALYANSLHFVPDSDGALRRVLPLLAAGGRVVVVEYAGRRASPWVPHPIPPERLVEIAARAGLTAPTVVGERPSAFGGTLYCAVLRADRGMESGPGRRKP